jgi:hypothetical protein
MLSVNYVTCSHVDEQVARQGRRSPNVGAEELDELLTAVSEILETLCKAMNFDAVTIGGPHLVDEALEVEAMSSSGADRPLRPRHRAASNIPFGYKYPRNIRERQEFLKPVREHNSKDLISR